MSDQPRPKKWLQRELDRAHEEATRTARYKAALEEIVSRHPPESWPEHPACMIAAAALGCPRANPNPRTSMPKRIYKYGTGQAIPDGAVYLSTVKQTSIYVEGTQPPLEPYPPHWEPCWLVWHYFLVEVSDA